MDTKHGLTEELLGLIKNWNDRDPVPKEQQDRARKIGQRINDIGGFNLMTDIYYDAKAANRYASVLQAYWDGIGEWRW